MRYTLDYCNTQNEKKFFSDNLFSDSSFLRGYLIGSNGRNERLRHVDFFSSIIEVFSQLRGIADTENSENEYYEVINTKGSLPITVSSIIKCLKAEKTEAPEEIISIIAQRHFNLIKNVGESLRKILRRERNKVNVGRAQQMDSQCLIWLSKQPGYNIAEKAGSKQEILSVVRHESYNTLENRVFKAFLKLCLREGAMYYAKYKERFPNSKRLNDVRRLVNLSSSILNFPIMNEIDSLKNNPKPNYVLQKNPNYSTIWALYQKLLKKYQIIEELWPYRHIITREYFALLFDMVFYSSDMYVPILKGRYWIDDIQSMNKNGFLNKSFTINYFSSFNGGFTSLYFTEKVNKIISIYTSNSSFIRFPFYFIPYSESENQFSSIMIQNNMIPIILNESNNCLNLSNNEIVLNLDDNLVESFKKQILSCVRTKL